MHRGRDTAPPHKHRGHIVSRIDWKKVVEAAKLIYGNDWWRFIAELKTMHSSAQLKAIEELLKRYEKTANRDPQTPK